MDLPSENCVLQQLCSRDISIYVNVRNQTHINTHLQLRAQ